jgi:hypothetical protein
VGRWATLLTIASLVALAGLGEATPRGPLGVCSPASRIWTVRGPAERAVLARATAEWVQFDRSDLPFLGPPQPAGIDTIALPFDSARTAVDSVPRWVVTEEGDSIRSYLHLQPTALFRPRLASPAGFWAQRFEVVSQGSGPDLGLRSDQSFWVVPMSYGRSCRLSPYSRPDWLKANDTVVFLFEADDRGTASDGSPVFFQTTWRGPYPFAGQDRSTRAADRAATTKALSIEEFFQLHGAPAVPDTVSSGHGARGAPTGYVSGLSGANVRESRS